MADLAEEVGLNRELVVTALSEGSYADAVRADEREATELGANGVPFFVVDRRYGFSGAQPADQILAVLDRAWTETARVTPAG
ncbi:DsbA family oxidoreductase [Actinokineospora iranica]|uniref:DSBA-like thioredoxin domain-containing protein n=1 Tax=Actinokineospora iranica TaxID=1271860 RepID=A0A1G6VIF2_9PSEU|nr:DsbA family protein [Actinokineospora iranica]SDD53281.1 DSBA-like thioredoxin domain-containing protein [Actinokineospora iranica]